MVDAHSLISIDTHDILQADATIITGILILLTVSVFYEKEIILKFWGNPIAFVAFSPIMFSISAGMLLLGSLENISEIEYKTSIIAFVIGLGYLILTIILTAYGIAKTRSQP